MTDYQAQFDKAHSVTEITEVNGFVILVADLDDEIARVEDDIERENEALRKGIDDKSAVDSEHYTQTMIALNAKLNGLRFISNQIEYYQRRKDEAIKKLQ